MVKQIAVSNLPAGTIESEVNGLFAQYGRVTKVLFRGNSNGVCPNYKTNLDRR